MRSVLKKDGTTTSFTYDWNGNMLTGDGRTVGFDYVDRPVSATLGGVTTYFAYAPDGGRYRQWTTGPSGPPFGPRTVYYVDKDYELTVWNDGSGRTEERTYVGTSVVIFRSSSSGRDVRYRHLDRLGSLDAVTGAITIAPPPGGPPTGVTEGATELMIDAHGYDPFGKPRAREWTPSSDQLHPGGEVGVTTDRGFTGHEHLDNLYLIHMNGRVYDYRLGRFLSVDPIISNPANSQAINPYSYIGNNPLSGIDPTGYEAETPSPTPCESAKYCPRDGTLGHDAKFSAVLNAKGDVIAQGGVHSNGAPGQGTKTPTASPADHGSPRDTAAYPNSTPQVRPLLIARDEMLSRFENGTPPSDKEVLQFLGQVSLAQRNIDTQLAGRPPLGGVNDPGSAINVALARSSLQRSFAEIRAALVMSGNPLGRELMYSELMTLAVGVAAGVMTTSGTQTPNRIYSARELMRRAAESGPFHNFPESFNPQIFERGVRTVTPNFWSKAKAGLSNDSVMYQLRGSVNGVKGTFEIGVRPSTSGNTEVIMHRFFRPDP